MAYGILVHQLGIKTEALVGRLPNLKSGLPENPQEILNLKTHFTCVHWTIFLRKIFTPFPTSSNHYNKHSQSTYYLPGFNPHDKHLRSGSTRNRPLGKRYECKEFEWTWMIPESTSKRSREVRWGGKEGNKRGYCAGHHSGQWGSTAPRTLGASVGHVSDSPQPRGKAAVSWALPACLAHRPVDSCH